MRGREGERERGREGERERGREGERRGLGREEGKEGRKSEEHSHAKTPPPCPFLVTSTYT